MRKVRKLAPPGPHWKAAEEYGIDMSLVESSLRRTHEERVNAHTQALATALVLREAMRKRNAQARRSRGAADPRQG